MVPCDVALGCDCDCIRPSKAPSCCNHQSISTSLASRMHLIHTPCSTIRNRSDEASADKSSSQICQDSTLVRRTRSSRCFVMARRGTECNAESICSRSLDCNCWMSNLMALSLRFARVGVAMLLACSDEVGNVRRSRELENVWVCIYAL